MTIVPNESTCIRCQAGLEPGAAACPHCGNDAAPPPSSSSTQEPPPYQEPQQVDAHTQQPSIAQPLVPYPNQARPIGVVAAKSPGIAVLLSIWLGAGQLYVGQVGLGICCLAFYAFLFLISFTGIGLVIAIPCWLIAFPILAVLASREAKAFNQRNGIAMR